MTIYAKNVRGTWPRRSSTGYAYDGGFGVLSPPKQSTKPSKFKCETL